MRKFEFFLFHCRPFPLFISTIDALTAGAISLLTVLHFWPRYVFKINMTSSNNPNFSGGAMVLSVYSITAFPLICNFLAVDDVLQVIEMPLITLPTVNFGHGIRCSEDWVEKLPHVGRRKLMDDDYCRLASALLSIHNNMFT